MGRSNEARRAVTSIVPVFTSASTGRNTRCTATRIASTTASRNAGSVIGGAVDGRGEVADLDLDGRHPGEPQQLPGLGVGAAVDEAGAGDDLALDQGGEPLPDGGGGARAGAVVVGGDAVGARGCGGRRGAG